MPCRQVETRQIVPALVDMLTGIVTQCSEGVHERIDVRHWSCQWQVIRAGAAKAGSTGQVLSIQSGQGRLPLGHCACERIEIVPMILATNLRICIVQIECGSDAMAFAFRWRDIALMTHYRAQLLS